MFGIGTCSRSGTYQQTFHSANSNWISFKYLKLKLCGLTSSTNSFIALINSDLQVVEMETGKIFAESNDAYLQQNTLKSKIEMNS